MTTWEQEIKSERKKEPQIPRLSDGLPILYFQIESQTSNCFTKWNQEHSFPCAAFTTNTLRPCFRFFFVRKLNGWLRLLHFMLLLEVQNIILTVSQLVAQKAKLNSLHCTIILNGNFYASERCSAQFTPKHYLIFDQKSFIT